MHFVSRALLVAHRPTTECSPLPYPPAAAVYSPLSQGAATAARQRIMTASRRGFVLLATSEFHRTDKHHALQLNKRHCTCLEMRKRRAGQRWQWVKGWWVTHTDTVRLVRHFGYFMCTKVPDERVSINEKYQLKNKRVEETNAIW